MADDSNDQRKSDGSEQTERATGATKVIKGKFTIDSLDRPVDAIDQVLDTIPPPSSPPQKPDKG